MSSSDILVIISLVVGLLSAATSFVVNRAAGQRDKRDDKVEKLLETLTVSVTELKMKFEVINDHSREIDTLKQTLSKLSLIERDLVEVKGQVKVSDDFKKDVNYTSQKSFDSASRAHQRLDDYAKNFTEIKSAFASLEKEVKENIAVLEKTVWKLTNLVESMQEKLKNDD